MAAMLNLTQDQIKKTRDALKTKMLAAREAFVDANPEYEDYILDLDEVRAVTAFAAKNGSVDDLQRDGELMANKDIAKMRLDAIRDGRSVRTIDLVTVKSEKNVPAEDKFRMTAWLPAKRYKVDGSVWKAGFQDPFRTEFTETTNAFVGAGGFGAGRFQVLRAKGLFQLMSEAEIENFAKEFPVDFELYFQLFL